MEVFLRDFFDSIFMIYLLRFSSYFKRHWSFRDST